MADSAMAFIEETGVFPAFFQFSPGPAEDVRVFFAPGRVNLIGEHTDYNGGYVLPAALQLGTSAIVRPRKDGQWRFASTSFPDTVVEFSPENLEYRENAGFANYPAGVIWVLRQEGYIANGADIFFAGNLPAGAGLSSSASVEVVTAFAMASLHHWSISKETLALYAQRAENQFVGVNCGIMDQFSVALGMEQHALSLHCQSLSYEQVPVELGDVVMVLTNSNKPHSLVESKYNERRSECETALSLLQDAGFSCSYLADLTPEQWPQMDAVLVDPVLKRRVRHVVFENHRAKEAPKLLRQGRLREFGEWMNASHRSLCKDYEVTGPELDTLAESAWQVEGCLGSRMTGGGFGGSTVSLVERHHLDVFQEHVARQYEITIGYAPSFYITGLGEGVRELTGEVEGK
ncbi:galactokinase [Alicyclobacillus sp. TC]|uniref:galactokinase n=1 Tax=Alicyclobacillus sp. TC TaxID=2606450 RepID=UPI001EE44486|nr:galactokinase [Alicyclobacillus sp. TC]